VIHEARSHPLFKSYPKVFEVANVQNTKMEIEKKPLQRDISFEKGGRLFNDKSKIEK
jgi:hypothetical protein